MELLIANAVGKVKEITWLDRKWLVAPVTMIVPGVLPGSKGPLLYTIEELKKNPQDWDGIPLVAPNHPTLNGSPVSAKSPRILESYGIGYVFNTQFNKALAAEAWFDIERCKKVDKRIIPLLRAGKAIELSTGLYPSSYDKAPEGAVDNTGVAYSWIPRGYRPDHLAILLDTIGACSRARGCGVLVNSTCEVDEMEVSPLSKLTVWQKLGEALGITTNALSHGDLREILRLKLAERFNPLEGKPNPTGGYTSRLWIESVYAKYVIYSLSEKSWKIGYTANLEKEIVSLSDDQPVEVVRVMDYKPVNNEETKEEGEDEWIVANDLQEVDIVTNPFPNEHASRIEDPTKFIDTSFRRKQITPGISAIMGKKTANGPMVIQAYRFDATKFTAEQAKKWLKDHDLTSMMFEASKPTNNSLNNGDDAMPLDPVQKKSIIDGLVTNCNCPHNVPWKGKDSNILNALSDDVLIAYDGWNKSINAAPVAPPVNNNNPTLPTTPGITSDVRNIFVDAGGNRFILNGSNQLVPVTVAPATNPAPQVPTIPVNNNGGTVSTPEEWFGKTFKDAPPEVLEIWNTAQEVYGQQRSELIERLVANTAGEAREAAIKLYSAMPIPQLKLIASTLPQQQNNRQEDRSPTLNWLRSGAPVNSPVINEEPLLPPVYDWSKK